MNNHNSHELAKAKIKARLEGLEKQQKTIEREKKKLTAALNRPTGIMWKRTVLRKIKKASELLKEARNYRPMSNCLRDDLNQLIKALRHARKKWSDFNPDRKFLVERGNGGVNMGSDAFLNAYGNEEWESNMDDGF